MTIRVASRSDRLAICSLLQQAWHSAGGARWDQLDALEMGCAALLAFRGAQAAGFSLFDLRASPVGRLSAVTVADGEQVADVWDELWSAAETYLREEGVQSAYYVGEAPWLLQLLTGSGFRQTSTLVSYEKIQDTPTIAGHPGVRLRPARREDLEALEEIDTASFPFLWRYPRRMLEMAMQPTSRLILAELDRRLIGYYLGTQDGGEGQIVRLAVLPEYRHKGVGSRLLADALDAFRRGRVRRVSVNTQSDNLPAQRLYERFGFRQTGEELPVLVKALSD
mgnify:FL=1